MNSASDRKYSLTLWLCAAAPALVILAFVARAVVVTIGPVVPPDHGSLMEVVDLPGITNPTFGEIETTKWDDAEKVVGNVIADQA